MKLTSLKQIDSAIKALRGRVAQMQATALAIAIAILEHGREHGDVSRAIRLVQALPTGNQQRQAVLWFQYYGSIGIDLTKDVCKRLNVENKRSAYVRGHSDGFDLDGARVNSMFAPYIEVTRDGETVEEKAPWFEGPNPKAFVPNTLVDFGEGVLQFANRIQKSLDAKKEVIVNGKREAVNLYELTPAQRRAANEAIGVLKLLGTQVGAEGQAAEFDREATRLRQRAAAISVEAKDKDADAANLATAQMRDAADQRRNPEPPAGQPEVMEGREQEQRNRNAA